MIASLLAYKPGVQIQFLSQQKLLSYKHYSYNMINQSHPLESDQLQGEYYVQIMASVLTQKLLWLHII